MNFWSEGMDFTIFENNIEVLDKRKGGEFRGKCIYQFVNTGKSSYHEEV